MNGGAVSRCTRGPDFHGDGPKPTVVVTVRRLTPLFRLNGDTREEGTLFVGAGGEVALNQLLELAEIHGSSSHRHKLR
jgi:hypothetical protein